MINVDLIVEKIGLSPFVSEHIWKEKTLQFYPVQQIHQAIMFNVAGLLTKKTVVTVTQYGLAVSMIQVSNYKIGAL